MPDTSRLAAALHDAIETQTGDGPLFAAEALEDVAELLGDDVTGETLDAALEESWMHHDWDCDTLDRIASQARETMIGVPA